MTLNVARQWPHVQLGMIASFKEEVLMLLAPGCEVALENFLGFVAALGRHSLRVSGL